MLDTGLITSIIVDQPRPTLEQIFPQLTVLTTCVHTGGEVAAGDPHDSPRLEAGHWTISSPAAGSGPRPATTPDALPRRTLST